MHTLSGWHFMYTHIQHTHQILVRIIVYMLYTNSKCVFHLGKGHALL